jgi:4-amino-4-deoxy-L-arabinose transferase-like glycosyltransferase
VSAHQPFKPVSFGPADIRFAWTALALLASGKLWFSVMAGPLPDEAYYWLWGQRLDWSYFDHPPLQAWMQAATTAVFGHSTFALRLPALLTSAANVALLGWWVRRAAASGQQLPLPVAAAVFFASPVIFIYSTLVFNDHLMVALLGLSAAAFAVAFERTYAEGRAPTAALWVAGLALGLATLAKYNAALLGLGAAVAIVIAPRLRVLLRSPHLYGAAALSVACLAPVLWWNLANDNASFRYNLVDRLSRDWSDRMTAEHVLVFLVLAVLTASPFLLPAVLRLARADVPQSMAAWRPLALAALAVSTLTCLAVAFLGPVQFYWNLTAWIAFLPLAALLMTRRMQRGHLALGLAVAFVYVINYSALPLAAMFGGADRESAIVYGWDEIAARVATERDTRGAEFLLATDYRTGAILAFETGDRHVEVISDRTSQFDLWFDERQRSGSDALILSDGWHPLSERVTQRFAGIEQVAEIPVIRFGRLLQVYQLHVGRGYKPR